MTSQSTYLPSQIEAIVSEQFFAAQVPAGRSGRRRRPDAEPALAVRNR